jgi:hypothetical protein
LNRLGATLCIALLLGVGTNARGETAKTQVLPSGTLASVGASVSLRLGTISRDAALVVAPLVSDIASPRSDELALRAATQIAAALHIENIHPLPLSLAAARSRQTRGGALVYVQLEIRKGVLRVTCDVYAVVNNAWERLRTPVPVPRAHAFATGAIDAEIRSFLPPIVLEQATLHKAKHDEVDVLAIGCGDVDEDGGLELVLVSRRRVVVAKVRGSQLVTERSANWSALSARAPVAMREPLATVLVAPPGHPNEIWLGTTDRGSLVVDGTLVVQRTLSGFPVPGGRGDSCIVAVPAANAFEGDAIPCEATPTRSNESMQFPSFGRFDGISVADRIAAVHEPRGRLRLERMQGTGNAPVTEGTIDSTGAQIALGDLDLDGVPEVIASSSTEDDAVVVTSVHDGVVTPRLRYPASAGVQAIGVCPPEERGIPAVVAAVGSEVWLVR